MANLNLPSCHECPDTFWCEDRGICLTAHYVKRVQSYFALFLINTRSKASNDSRFKDYPDDDSE